EGEGGGEGATGRGVGRGGAGGPDLPGLPLVGGDDGEAVLGGLGDRRRALILRFREALRRVVEPALRQRDGAKTETGEIADAFLLRRRELTGGVGGLTADPQGGAARGLGTSQPPP